MKGSLEKIAYDVSLALWTPAVVKVAMSKAVVGLGISVLVDLSSTVESHVDNSSGIGRDVEIKKSVTRTFL